MLSKIKLVALSAAAISVGGCTSLFSPYDSEFSCKNQDHGNCESPLVAYDRAVGAHVDEQPSPIVEGQHVHNEDTNYEGYQEAVYDEVARIVDQPNTPILVAPKTVRTLVLPYADPNKEDRLYMPRYVYSILEDSRFVLGNYLNGSRATSGFDQLLEDMGGTVEKEGQ